MFSEIRWDNIDLLENGKFNWKIVFFDFCLESSCSVKSVEKAYHCGQKNFDSSKWIFKQYQFTQKWQY